MNAKEDGKRKAGYLRVTNCLKGVSGKVIIDKKGIKDSWKEYMEKLMNEENEWDYKISTEVNEGPADYIRINEVAATLKNSPKRGLMSSPDLDPDLG